MLEDVVAEGNTGIALNRFTGTNKGPMDPSMPATNKPVNYESFDFVKIVDGKVAEHWSVADNVTQFTQLGLLPTAGQPAATMAATATSK